MHPSLAALEWAEWPRLAADTAAAVDHCSDFSQPLATDEHACAATPVLVVVECCALDAARNQAARIALAIAKRRRTGVAAFLDLTRGGRDLQLASIAAQLRLPAGLAPAERWDWGALALDLTRCRVGDLAAIDELLPAPARGWSLVLAQGDRSDLAPAISALAARRELPLHLYRLDSSAQDLSARADPASASIAPLSFTELLERLAQLAHMDEQGDEIGARRGLCMRLVDLLSPLMATAAACEPALIAALAADRTQALAVLDLLSREGHTAAAATLIAAGLAAAESCSDDCAATAFHVAHGLVLLRGGDPYGARLPMARAQEIAARTSDAATQVIAAHGEAQRRSLTGDLGAARAALVVALARLDDATIAPAPGTPAAPSRSMLLRLAAEIEMRSGALAEANALAVAAHDAAIADGDRIAAARALFVSGAIAMERGDFVSAHGIFASVLALMSAVAGRSTLAARAHGAIAQAHHAEGAHRVALIAYVAALDLHRAASAPLGEMLDLFNMAATLRAMEEKTIAFAALIVAGRIARGVGGPLGARVQERLATMRAQHGDAIYRPFTDLADSDIEGALAAGLDRLAP